MEQVKAYQRALLLKEVYVSDIRNLHQYFNNWQGYASDTPVMAVFGIPFLQLKEGHRLLGFVSLVPGIDGCVTFKIHQEPTVSLCEKDTCYGKIVAIFEQYWLAVYPDNTALQCSISRLLNWLNRGCN